MSSDAKVPTLLWADRERCIYVTIDVQDAKDPKVDLVPTEDGAATRLTFESGAGSSGTGGGVARGGTADAPAGEGEGGGAAAGPRYSLDLPLYDLIDKDKSKITVTARNIMMVLEKAEVVRWPRLAAKTAKAADKHIKVDWSRWVDSDDEGADDFDASAFSAFGGGRAGMEEMLARMGADPGALPGLAGGAAAAAAGGDEGSDDRDDDALPTLEAGEAGAEMAAV